MYLIQKVFNSPFLLGSLLLIGFSPDYNLLIGASQSIDQIPEPLNDAPSTSENSANSSNSNSNNPRPGVMMVDTHVTPQTLVSSAAAGLSAGITGGPAAGLFTSALALTGSVTNNVLSKTPVPDNLKIPMSSTNPPSPKLEPTYEFPKGKQDSISDLVINSPSESSSAATAYSKLVNSLFEIVGVNPQKLTVPLDFIIQKQITLHQLLLVIAILVFMLMVLYTLSTIIYVYKQSIKNKLDQWGLSQNRVIIFMFWLSEFRKPIATIIMPGFIFYGLYTMIKTLLYLVNNPLI